MGCSQKKKEKKKLKKKQNTKVNRSSINSPRELIFQKALHLRLTLGANKIFVCLFVKHMSNTHPVSRLVSRLVWFISYYGEYQVRNKVRNQFPLNPQIYLYSPPLALTFKLVP